MPQVVKGDRPKVDVLSTTPLLASKVNSNQKITITVGVSSAAREEDPTSPLVLRWDVLGDPIANALLDMPLKVGWPSRAPHARGAVLQECAGAPGCAAHLASPRRPRAPV